MKSLWILGFFGLVFITDVLSDSAESLEKGWGTEIEWTDLSTARKEAVKSGKPVMVLITKSWCGACKALRPYFSDSKLVNKLSKRFVMVHLQDDDEPEGEEFRVDGRYIPRIYFLGIDGKVMPDVFNSKGRHVKESKFYYGKVTQIVTSMKTVLRKLKLPIDDQATEEESDEEMEDDVSKGFGGDINWMTYEEGLKEAKESKRKLLLLIHKSWCGACKALKPKLAASEKFAEMSSKFVMVNVEDDEEPSGGQFVVDGEYVPRVFFMDPEGKVIEPIWNEGTNYPHTKYYYSSAEELTAVMGRALRGEEKEQEKIEKEAAQKDNKPWWMPKAEVEGISNGFGTDIAWHTYEDGLELAKQSKKVMVLIIHKTSCGSCKSLKPRIASDKELAEMSKKFVMVNVKDGDEPKDKQFQPDGSYVPRIVFVDSNGKVMNEFWNEGTNYNHVKYYYQDGNELMESMERVLKKFRKPASDHGWGTSFEWVHIDDAYQVARDAELPLLLIIHKTWCSACKAFKRKFAKSESLLKHSDNFVMVNIQDDDSKAEKEFDVDGAYVPRIYFIDPYTKKIMKEISNQDPSYTDYKYAYGEAKQLVSSMRRADKIGVSKQPASDQGFGSAISWVPLKDAISQAADKKKPIMLVLHKSWCQHSQALKKIFADSKNIGELSQHFFMANLQDDEIPKDKYSIDGSYVPRILFLDHKGDVHKHMTNPKSPVDDATFFYNKAEDVVKAMKRISPAHGLDRGYGQDIDWVTLDGGLAEAKASNKPVMIIIHKTWCGACKAFKPHIANSTEIRDMSEKFVMINLEDDEEPKDSKFNVDGQYFPRVFFLDSNGDILRDVHNIELNYLKFKYAYGDADTVIGSMKKVLQKYKHKKSPSETTTTESTATSKETSVSTSESTTESTIESPTNNTIDHGLGKHFDWVSLEEGYIKAKESWKPLMLIIHKSWCTACQSFRPHFVKSGEIETLSKEFVMVNVEDEFDHTNEKFDIDGSYIPRTFFLDPLGEVMKDIKHDKSIYKENGYYYYDASSVVQSMRKAIDAVKAMPKRETRDEL